MSIHINFGQIGNQIRQGFEHLPQQIAHVPHELERAGLDPNAIQDWIHHETQEVLQSAAGEVASLAFKKSAELARSFYNEMQALRNSKPDLADAIDEVGIEVSLSIITFKYHGFMARAEGLCNLLDEQAQVFALTRSFIRNILVNTGPTEIDVSVSGELFTSALSAGFSIHAPLALAVELIDTALEKAGLPE